MIDYYWFYIPSIACFAIFIINVIYQGWKEERLSKIRAFDDVEQRCSKALESSSISAVRDAICALEIAYQQAASVLDVPSRSVYETDMEDLKSHLADLEEENWSQKAQRYLDEFLQCYDMITSGCMNNFRDVDQLFKLKRRCISAWQSYFSIDLLQYNTTIYPHRYLREYMDDMYDPCVESHESLEKKLSECIQVMRPEYKRKMQLLNLMVTCINDRGSVLRSELLRTSFDGYTRDEIKCCYNALLKSNRLFEYKIGNRYFVSLSDKEQSKRNSVKREVFQS